MVTTCLLCIQLLSHARLSQEIILLHVASLLGIHMTCSLFLLSLFRFLYLPPCSSASALTHITICSHFLNCRHLFVYYQWRISFCSWVCRFGRSLQVQSIVNKMSWTPRIWMWRPPPARRGLLVGHPHDLLPIPSVASSFSNIYLLVAQLSLMRSNTTQFIHTFSDPRFAVHIVVGGFKRIVEVVIWTCCNSFNPQSTRCQEILRIWMRRPPLARRWWRHGRQETCRLNRISLRFIWCGSFRSRNLWWCFYVNSGDG